jgi:hypothetical protein
MMLAAAGLRASDETPVQVAQKLFDAMHTHNAPAASDLFVPGATLTSIDAAGQATIIPFDKFVERVGSSKSNWLERMWNPTALESGSIAVVWAEYDFHLNGTFGHCGIDSFQMIKTAAGWKIGGITYTSVTAGCKPSPLGPPTEH